MDIPRDAHSGGLNSALAAVIDAERKLFGLTLDQVADQAHINRRTFARRLGRGDRSDITVNEADQIAAVFRLTSAELVAKAEDWRRRMAGDPLPEGAEERELAARMAREARDAATSEKPPREGDDGRSVREQK